jgi:hypothetical protein
MRHDDGSRYEMADALRDSLRSLNDLRLVPHNDLRVLRLKQHVHEKIAELEGEEMYELEAA